MKIPLHTLPLAMLVSSALVLPTTVSAEMPVNGNREVNNLTAQVADLQKEVNALKRQLRGDKSANNGQAIRKHKRLQNAELRRTPNQIAGQQTQPTKLKPETEQKQSSLPKNGADFFQMTRNQSYLPFDLDVPGQAFVSTGPYVGVPVQYSGSYLIINSPSVNTDLQLLNIRKSIITQEKLLGASSYLKAPYHSHLLLSGIVEGQASYANIGGQPSTSTIDVTNVTVDMFVLGPSDWLLGFVEMTYDNGPPSGSSYVVSNSRVFINKAFVTIGDLKESPYYGTFGQSYVPFGTFSSLMVSESLPKILARTKARYIQLGMQQQTPNAFYGAAYIFRGDSHAASVSKINNGGLNVGYKFVAGSVNANIGGGILANLADSAGMQLGTGFQYNEQLVHRVPALNARGLVSVGEHWNFIAEYIGATTTFNPTNMSYKGRGAKPWAIDTQAAYSFYILGNKPSSIGVGYGESSQAMAIGMPLARYSLVFNTSLLRNTLQSFELRHDRNYAASATANGPGGPGGACTASVCSASGKSDNVATLQFDYYF